MVMIITTPLRYLAGKIELYKTPMCEENTAVRVVVQLA